jgi:hypothetical protein
MRASMREWADTRSAATRCVAALLLAACGGDGPMKARGTTPVRYVICAVGDVECRVVARFDNLESCERHREIDGLLCDRVSTPDVVTCRPLDRPPIAVSYCTK